VSSVSHPRLVNGKWDATGFFTQPTIENCLEYVFCHLGIVFACLLFMQEKLLKPHGGYQKLKSYQNAVIVYDATVKFSELYISKFSRTCDQMVQAARSGKQNIVEGSMASATSKKTELKLIGVARASLEELLADYTDFLRQNCIRQWQKEDKIAQEVRALVYRANKSYMTYRPYIEDLGPETAANTMICLIHQTNYLLNQQLRQLAEQFLRDGGFTERLFKLRQRTR